MTMTSPFLDQQLAALRREFNGWTIVYTRPDSEPPRWWATRGALVRERLDERGTLTTRSPEELRRQLRRVEAHRPSPVRAAPAA
ncbi:hypothetical protein [Actinomadura terrae]|uniref:hypothetical protein n=1 Tax=Actinomadura terrae TaxID=604353 RepID=UPI001FA7AF62|nr:hypothetical protein [Actinomadura terrae]